MVARMPLPSIYAPQWKISAPARRHHAACWFLLALCACAPSKQIPGVVVREPGQELTSVPGPMPNFGPFKTAADAVFAACPFILSKPHAHAGPKDDANLDVYFKISTEYCSLVYYTPDNKFEMSMLATEYQNNSEARECPALFRVDDPRYPGDSLKYIYIIHNHTYERELSNEDVDAIVELGLEYGFQAPVTDKDIYIGIIAFFSRGPYDQPTCDGFFQYIPLTAKITRWLRSEDGRWKPEEYADVVSTGGRNFKIVRKH